MDDAAIEACQKLFDTKAQLEMVIQAGVEAYKLSTNYLDQKIKYFAKAYFTGKDEVRLKMAAWFLDLDLAFLDQDSENAELAPEAEATVDPSMPTKSRSPFPLVFCSFILSIALVYFSRPIFVVGLWPHILIVNERIFFLFIISIVFWFP